MLPAGCEGKGTVSFLLVLLVGIVLGAGGLYLFNTSVRQIIPDLPGMKKQGEGAAPGQKGPSEASKKGGGKILYWTDAMNPSFRSNKPGKAPDGMDLVPVYAGAAAPRGLPPGSVEITARKQQLIGVQYGVVKSGPETRTIRAVARLAVNETSRSRIQLRINGWIEKVFVDFPGMYVKKGDPLLSLYSPDLVASERELLVALKARQTLGDSEFGGVGSNARELYRSALERFRLWGLPDREIQNLEKSGKPIYALTFASPVSGFVITKNAFPGQRITPETELYSIADLSTIWVYAELYEYEVPLVKVGQTALMDLSYFPGEKFRGKINYIYPEINPKTRTLRVRMEFPNPGFRLKPDMYANVDLKANLGTRMYVPESAVLNEGTEQIVFVARPDGYFEPRKVALGPEADNGYIVLSGLSVGEKIVTSGNFLIDSESRLKSATGAMAGMPGMGNKSGKVHQKQGLPSPAPTPPGGMEQHPSGAPTKPKQAPMPGMKMD
jgi:multidrug efflux pump subunit AcrA (membrane-fusion protein)